MVNKLARKNPYTDLWMNLGVCAPCRKALEKGGKHRKHDCAVDYIVGNVCVICDCECQAVTTGFIESTKNLSMALDFY